MLIFRRMSCNGVFSRISSLSCRPTKVIATTSWRRCYYKFNQRTFHQTASFPTARRTSFKPHKMNETVPNEQQESSFPKQLRESIVNSMKYKERSHQTLEEVHKPGLESIPPVTNDSDPPCFDVIFIGDSMLERLKTTGKNTKLHNLPRSFNLGVGGDKVENVLYRLHTGYISLLERRPTKLWVVHIGSNNLRPKKGLKDSDPSDYSNFALLIKTLRVLSPKSKVLVTGLFRRKDISDEIIRTTNEKLARVLCDLDSLPDRVPGTSSNAAVESGRLLWEKPTEAVNTDLLADHVHLNEEGYQLWDESMYLRILEILGEPAPSQGAD
ncbi:hypothetical protein TWF730_011106 [Orbilia blumenaviensis]|uniref:SGNH hydrolase-type esterase domain-containing protein n=1 Tax=Orbilia blumenaviensis TaxID=1796055 RepID=A0AAV9UJQ7_9PEZI